MKILKKYSRNLEKKHKTSRLDTRVLSSISNKKFDDCGCQKHSVSLYEPMVAYGASYQTKKFGVAENLLDIGDSTQTYLTRSNLFTQYSPTTFSSNIGSNSENMMNENALSNPDSFFFSSSNDKNSEENYYIRYLKIMADLDDGYQYHLMLFNIYIAGDQSKGVQQDMKLAKYYLEIAAERGKFL